MRASVVSKHQGPTPSTYLYVMQWDRYRLEGQYRSLWLAIPYGINLEKPYFASLILDWRTNTHFFLHDTFFANAAAAHAICRDMDLDEPLPTSTPVPDIEGWPLIWPNIPNHWKWGVT